MNLLTPDPGLLFWMVLSFGVVFFLLAKFGFPVIVKAINERKEFIEMSLLSAKQANERLVSIQAEGEKLLAEAKAQQKEIIAGAIQEKLHERAFRKRRNVPCRMCATRWQALLSTLPRR